MLLIVALGLAVWIAVSVPVALLFVRIIDLEEDTPASAPGDVQHECVDLALPVGASLDRPRGADQVAGARQRVRA
jgi:hypothetical protein